MRKILASTILILSFLFSGCVTKVVKEPYYIECNCPKIKVIKTVAPIEVNIDDNKSITQDSCKRLVTGSKQLRKSETYYIKELTSYNKKFTKKEVDK